MAIIDRVVDGKAVLLAGFVLAVSASFDANALPLFARQTGESCSACHAGGRATEKIGAFVPELSVNNAAVGPAPAYVPLSVLLDSRLGNYGSSVGFLNRGSAYDVRNLTVDSFWRQGRNLRVGAQYTLYNKFDAAANGSGENSWRRDAGTFFFYLQRSY